MWSELIKGTQSRNHSTGENEGPIVKQKHRDLHAKIWKAVEEGADEGKKRGGWRRNLYKVKCIIARRELEVEEENAKP